MTKKTQKIILSFLFFINIGLINAQTTVTKSWNGPTISVDNCGVYCNSLPGVTFSTADFPVGSTITDVNVSVTWRKSKGSTCIDSPINQGYSHEETSFRIDSPSNNIILAPPNTWSGSTSTQVTTVFDQSASTVIGGGVPTSGTFQPNTGNLNDFNTTIPFGNWYLRAGDNGTNDLVCVSSYSVTITTAIPTSPEDYFITTWQTTNANESITIPTNPSYTYNYTIDWGDGNTSTGQIGNATHSYETPNNYEVKISGIFPAIIFNHQGDIDKIIEINQWGTQIWESMSSAFMGCSNLQGTAIDTPNLSNVTNMTNMFFGASSFNQNIGSWNTNNVTDMSYMFYNASSFNQNINDWNVSNVTNMSNMFYSASSFNQNIGSWNVSNVTNMSYLFFNASSFNQNISGWNISNVTNMSYMLAAPNFNQDISSWNVSNVVNMEAMFGGSAFNQNIGSWNVSNVTNMRYMFLNAIFFNQNIGDWDVSNVTNMESMFEHITLSTTNYDALLIGWETQNLQPNLNFHGGNSMYCAGEIAHNSLTNTATNNWTISDGGLDCSAYAPIPDITSLTNVENECLVTLNAPTADNGTTTGTTPTVFPITTQGITIITWTYTNSYTTSTQTQNVILTDVTAPIADITTLNDITGECSIEIPTAPTATDNCIGEITGTTTTVFPITMQGTTIITWTYDDGNGNISTQTQNVILIDLTAPIADTTSLNDLTGECTIEIPTAPTATDNCIGEITGTTTTIFPITTQGTTIITWTYDDGNGNISTQTQNVILIDFTPPIVDITSLNDLTDECSVEIPTAPTATDNCIGEITGTTTTIFPITTQGTTIITWTYNDGNGNISTQTQNVVLTDVTSPVSDVTNLVDILSECEIEMPIAPTATDNCANTITGTTTNSFPITTQGITPIIWTFNDGNGNTSIQIQNVIIDPIDNSVTQNGEILTANTTGYSYQWIDCNNDNTPITGQINQTFTATNNGNYGVIITNEDGCYMVSSCFSVTTIGISETHFDIDLIAYPNPTNGEFTIKLDDTYQNITISILNMLGQVINVSTYNNINSINMNINNIDGIYFLQIQSENGKKSNLRVIKN